MGYAKRDEKVKHQHRAVLTAEGIALRDAPPQ